jgi:hypothetical protein
MEKDETLETPKKEEKYVYTYENSFECKLHQHNSQMTTQAFKDINEGKNLKKAHRIIATQYRHGWGLHKNRYAALEHYEISFKLGSSISAYELCKIYMGLDSEKMHIYENYPKALKYAEAGANFPVGEDNRESDIELCASMVKVVKNHIIMQEKGE